jgi:hypothetical protein
MALFWLRLLAKMLAIVRTAAYPQNMGRGWGDDGIYRVASRSRFVGAISLGFRPDGKRVRKGCDREDEARGQGQAQVAA